MVQGALEISAAKQMALVKDEAELETGKVCALRGKRVARISHSWLFA